MYSIESKSKLCVKKKDSDVSKTRHVACPKKVSILVKSSVLANTANIVIKIGPNTGWKLFACVKLKNVFPNQICTISHIMPVTVQCAEPV